jgi:alkyldihydroxyacetonephosphate synthase
MESENMHHLTGYMREQLGFELADIVGEANVLADEVSRRAAAVDQYWLTHMWGQAGEHIPIPDFVVRPDTTAQVAAVVRLCNLNRIPVVARGGGSGTQGGASTPFGGVVLDLTRMDRILEIDETSLVVTVEAGLNGRVLENALNERGLMLAHYPSSVDISTVGGYVAARGSGVMSTKYGKAEDLVLSAEVVLADGSIMETIRTPNHASGPGLLQLFVGSEGTLGIITTLRFRIDPIPSTRLFRVVSFDDVHHGLEAGRRIMTDRLQPAVMRLYDAAATARSLVSTGHSLDPTQAHLVIMTDGHPEMAAYQMSRSLAICLSEGGHDLGSGEGEHWWEHRYDFYQPPLMPAYPLMYGTTETVTDYASIPALYEAKKRLIEVEYAEWGAKYSAHFSHWFPWGTMIYDRFYIAEPPADPAECLRLHNRIWADAVRVNLAHGGVLNEHHGIGLKLGNYMREMSETSFDVLHRVKHTLDPNMVLNPGKLGLGVG